MALPEYYDLNASNLALADTGSIVVEGAGTIAANGIFLIDDPAISPPTFTQVADSNYTIVFGSGTWEIKNTGTGEYEYDTTDPGNSGSPVGDGWAIIGAGSSPTPTSAAKPPLPTTYTL